MRVEHHPILTFQKKDQIRFFYNGELLFGRQGDTIASALHDNGKYEYSKSSKHHRSRGFYCAIGNCGSCNMVVNGVPNVRTCVTLLEEGMKVTTQSDRGVLK